MRKTDSNWPKRIRISPIWVLWRDNCLLRFNYWGKIWICWKTVQYPAMVRRESDPLVCSQTWQSLRKVRISPLSPASPAPPVSSGHSDTDWAEPSIFPQSLSQSWVRLDNNQVRSTPGSEPRPAARESWEEPSVMWPVWPVPARSSLSKTPEISSVAATSTTSHRRLSSARQTGKHLEQLSTERVRLISLGLSSPSQTSLLSTRRWSSSPRNVIISD